MGEFKVDKQSLASCVFFEWTRKYAFLEHRQQSSDCLSQSNEPCMKVGLLQASGDLFNYINCKDVYLYIFNIYVCIHLHLRLITRKGAHFPQQAKSNFFEIICHGKSKYSI